ncbi:hypothetical protein NMY22_g8546 [Coprinellus aureogranulatus]|nr:hypothetical protein NMY22_g8546 [Coprinellus aureogranulatus]
MERGNIGKYLSDPGNPSGSVDRLLLISDIACGMSYLHQEGIVHGDLKGANILVSASGRACLADFGLSRLANPASGWTTCDQQAMRSPLGPSDGKHQNSSGMKMRLKSRSPSSPISIRSGAFATRCAFPLAILHLTLRASSWECLKPKHAHINFRQIMVGKPPYYHLPNEFAVVRQVPTGTRPRRPSDPAFQECGLTESVWSLMQACWDKDPKRRPTAQDIQQDTIFTTLDDRRPRQQWGFTSAAEFRRLTAPPSPV